MSKRQIELPQVRALLLGEQGSGKSTRERFWTDQLIRWKIYGKYVLRCILVFDRFMEDEIWLNFGPCVSSIDEFWEVSRSETRRLGLDHEHIPPCAVIRAGMEPEAYIPFLRLAIDEGDFMVVFCEVQQFAPASPGAGSLQIGRGVTLDHLFSRGRHIPDRDGVTRRFHYIADTQEAVHLSTVLRNQTNLVASGPLEGANNLRWVKDNFGRNGRELASRVQAAKEHEWTILRNKMDRRVPEFPSKISTMP